MTTDPTPDISLIAFLAMLGSFPLVLLNENLIVVPPLVLFGTQAFLLRRRRLKENNFLNRQKGPQGVESAVEALDYNWDPSIKKAAVRALKKLLPALKASDEHNLTKKTKSRLSATLREPHSSDFHIAVLAALEQIGNGDSLEDVISCASFTTNKKVREAAYRCEVVLRERAKHADSRITLLRPTNPEESQAQGLLRPGFVPTESDSLLLRPELSSDPRHTSEP